jgi:hypothetical protein
VVGPRPGGGAASIDPTICDMFFELSGRGAATTGSVVFDLTGPRMTTRWQQVLECWGERL